MKKLLLILLLFSPVHGAWGHDFPIKVKCESKNQKIFIDIYENNFLKYENNNFDSIHHINPRNLGATLHFSDNYMEWIKHEYTTLNNKTVIAQGVWHLVDRRKGEYTVRKTDMFKFKNMEEFTTKIKNSKIYFSNKKKYKTQEQGQCEKFENKF